MNTNDASAARQSEVAAVLLADPSFLGEVYRLANVDGMNVAEIVEMKGLANASSVYTYQRNIRLLLGVGEDFPTTASVANLTVNAYRRVLRARNVLSAATVAALETELDRLEAILGIDVNELDLDTAVAATARYEASHAEGGVYVYTMPVLVKMNQYEGRDDGRMLMKVGMTGGSFDKRVQSQCRSTGLFEDPILLRTYVDPSGAMTPVEMERKFHMALDLASHERPQGVNAGREWFTTSVGFLDMIAGLIGLTVNEVSNVAK